MEKDFITFYFYWLGLGQTAFCILLYIRLFAEDKKTLQCDIRDIKEYFWLKDTNEKMYEELENLKQLKYISYTKGKRKTDYTLIINDDYMQKLVDREIKQIDEGYEMIDKYINIENYRKTLMITRATKQNIDIILHFNRDEKGKRIDKNIISVNPIAPIKLYIYSCGYDENFKKYDYTTYNFLGIDLNGTKSISKNASDFLLKCPLVMQKYCKELKENEKAKKEQKKRIKEGEQEQQHYIKPLGNTHYITDTDFLK